MIAFLGIISFIVFIFFGIKFLRKKGSKKRNILITGISFLLLVFFMAVDPNDVETEDNSKNEEVKQEKEDVAEQEENDKAEQKKKDKAEQEKKDKAEQEEKDNAEQEKKDKAEQEEKDKVEQKKKDKAEQEKKDNAEQEKKDNAEQEKKDKAEQEKKDKAEQEKKEVEYDELQQIYLDIDKSLSYDELLEKLDDSNLFYKEKPNDNYIKIAKKEKVTPFSHAEEGDNLRVEYSEEGKLNFAEYHEHDIFITLINYEDGTYYSFRDQPEYAGYYINTFLDKAGEFTIEYDNGNKTEEEYLDVDTKEEQFNYMFDYEADKK